MMTKSAATAVVVGLGLLLGLARGQGYSFLTLGDWGGADTKPEVSAMTLDSVNVEIHFEYLHPALSIFYVRWLNHWGGLVLVLAGYDR
jgi:hypothetical protein